VSARRGVSLVETVVVLFLGVVLLLSLLPIAIGLLRQESALKASTLNVETFPLLWERLGRDFSEAGGATVSPPFVSPLFRIVLSPPHPGAPEVTWDFRNETIVRTLVSTDDQGRETRNARAWTIEGRFRLLYDELAFERWVLRYSPPRGEEEIFAYFAGRPTRPIGAKPERKP
jgi:hypothetical protein